MNRPRKTMSLPTGFFIRMWRTGVDDLHPLYAGWINAYAASQAKRIVGLRQSDGWISREQTAIPATRSAANNDRCPVSGSCFSLVVEERFPSSSHRGAARNEMRDAAPGGSNPSLSAKPRLASPRLLAGPSTL
jgi:hypothetical protein